MRTICRNGRTNSYVPSCTPHAVTTTERITNYCKMRERNCSVRSRFRHLPSPSVLLSLSGDHERSTPGRTPPRADKLADPMSGFNLISPFQPQGDQPQAIESLVSGLERGDKHQVLLGVTGSGKTFTVAKVVERVN